MIEQLLIGGASRHAKDIIATINSELVKIVLFDDITIPKPLIFLNNFSIINDIEKARIYFKTNPYFVIGIGGTKSRRDLYNKLISVGGLVKTVIAPNSIIGNYDITLGEGLNIMPFVFISNSVSIGLGSLINTKTSIHHDVTIGNFCEISPNATLLGGVKIGNLTSIGASVTILPNIVVGNNVVVGAGSVVTKDIPDYSLVVGVPGRLVKKLNPI